MPGEEGEIDEGALASLETPPSPPPQAHPKPKRDPTAVKTMSELYRACHEDFGMQPAEVLRELGVRSQMELTDLPSELYARVAEVKIEP
jgi:hypothetical protein